MHPEFHHYRQSSLFVVRTSSLIISLPRPLKGRATRKLASGSPVVLYSSFLSILRRQRRQPPKIPFILLLFLLFLLIRPQIRLDVTPFLQIELSETTTDRRASSSSSSVESSLSESVVQYTAREIFPSRAARKIDTWSGPWMKGTGGGGRSRPVKGRGRGREK